MWKRRCRQLAQQSDSGGFEGDSSHFDEEDEEEDPEGALEETADSEVRGASADIEREQSDVRDDDNNPNDDSNSSGDSGGAHSSPASELPELQTQQHSMVSAREECVESSGGAGAAVAVDGPEGGDGCCSNRSDSEPHDPELEFAFARMRDEIRDASPCMVERAFRNLPPMPGHMSYVQSQVSACPVSLSLLASRF